MKAVFVIALLALCAFSLKRPANFERKTVSFNTKAPRVDILNFTPEVPDCAYTLKLKYHYFDSGKEVEGIDKSKAYVGGEHTALTMEGKVNDIKFEYLRFRRADVATSQLDVESGKGDGDKFCDYFYNTKGYISTSTWATLLLGAVYTDPYIVKHYMEDTFYYDEDLGKMEFGGVKDVQVYHCTYTYCSTWIYGEYLGVKDGKVVGWYNQWLIPYVVVVDDYDQGASEDKWSLSSKYEDCDLCTCEDEHIFEDVKPVPETCELDDAASTVKAIAALVLAMMVLFF